MTKNVNKNSNKNIINIKIGDTKKKRRKSKKKVKPRQQSPIIISAGGSIPYGQQPPQPQPQIQNLHYNKRSDDYFREALAPREKYKSILNNVNTKLNIVIHCQIMLIHKLNIVIYFQTI